MQTIRALLRANRKLALAVMVLALAIKAAMPAGYMIGDKAHVLTVTICADASRALTTIQIAVPSDEKSAGHAQAEGGCAWALLAMASLAAADVALLALALAFILALGFAPTRSAPPARCGHLRPPLRGPPAFA